MNNSCLCHRNADVRTTTERNNALFSDAEWYFFGICMHDSRPNVVVLVTPTLGCKTRRFHGPFNGPWNSASLTGMVKFAQNCGHWQCFSWLFVSDRTVLTGAIINGPNFYPKLILEAKTIIGYRRPAASHVDRPSRTLLTDRTALQDVVLLRRMTTTALVTGQLPSKNAVGRWLPFHGQRGEQSFHTSWRPYSNHITVSLTIYL